MASLLKTVVALTALTSTACAAPHRSGRGGKPAPPPLPLAEINFNASIPKPASEGLKLQYITLGLGTQNYSCAAGAATPSPVGAVARLWDATKLLTHTPHAVGSLSAQYLQAFEPVYTVKDCTNPDGSLDFSCQDTVNVQHLPIIGDHFFTADAVPSFDLNQAHPPRFLASKKAGEVSAPANAYPGSKDEGAVAWLYLVDDGSGVSKCLKAVYRVETAGGSPPASCEGAPEYIEVPYAAEYWFYD